MEKEKPKVIAIHSQSNRKDGPLDVTAPEEEVFDGRALSLLDVFAVGLTHGIEKAYENYFQHTLQQEMPQLIVPTRREKNLSESILSDPQAIEQLKTFQNGDKTPLVLSVFDPTESEEKLAADLSDQLAIVPEINFTVAKKLGNKAGFRVFCKKYNIPQLPGGIFGNLQALEQFVNEAKNNSQGVIVKHPFGTAGEGITIVPKDKEPSQKDKMNWGKWIRGGDSVVAEVFNPNGGEHAVHVSIDPLNGESKLMGVYDQLVYKTEQGSLSHYGCIYPSEDKTTRTELEEIAYDKLIPALTQEGYTGPACFDVLSNPTHFMELNTRAGANWYAHRLVEKVAKNVYGIENTKDVAFMFLASIPHEITSFEEFEKKYHEVLQPQENGMVIFPNPNRHKFGKYDVIAMSPKGIDQAKKIMKESLTKIWGEEKTKEIFDKIYQRKQ